MKLFVMCLLVFVLGFGGGFWFGTMKSVRAFAETLADGITSGGMVFGETFYEIRAAGKEAEDA